MPTSLDGKVQTNIPPTAVPPSSAQIHEHHQQPLLDATLTKGNNETQRPDGNIQPSTHQDSAAGEAGATNIPTIAVSSPAGQHASDVAPLATMDQTNMGQNVKADILPHDLKETPHELTKDPDNETSKLKRNEIIPEKADDETGPLKIQMQDPELNKTFDSKPKASNGLETGRPDESARQNKVNL